MPPPHEFSCWSGVIVVAVLIHPSGMGNPAGARNWRNTIERPIEFRVGAVGEALAPDERAVLERLHPEGAAPFWGAHGLHGAQIRRLREDDVVVLTGNGRVRAVGRVGLVADNARLGDALWPRHPVQGSYRHAYSLVGLELVDLPLAGLRQAGITWFQTPLYVDDARADAVLEALGDAVPEAIAGAVSPVEREFQEVQQYEAADDAVARDLSWVREIKIETLTLGDVPVRGRGSSTMHRGENLLVHAYAASLGPGLEAVRYVTPSGVTDLDVIGDGHHELVEAKSSAGRTYVRQALAQLLDYAPALGERRPGSLAALFPTRPGDDAIALLHRYGVTCIYRTEDERFARLEAPAEVREAIARLW